MQTKAYPNCCTAKVLVGFGQTTTADFEIRPEGNLLTVEQIKAQLGQSLNIQRMEGRAMVSCVTNDKQINANIALEECGFQSSDWMSKQNHPETKIKLWWFPLNEQEING